MGSTFPPFLATVQEDTRNISGSYFFHRQRGRNGLSGFFFERMVVFRKEGRSAPLFPVQSTSENPLPFFLRGKDGTRFWNNISLYLEILVSKVRPNAVTLQTKRTDQALLLAVQNKTQSSHVLRGFMFSECQSPFV